MKTLAFVVAALFALPLAAHASRKPVSSAKPRKISSAKPRKISSAKPRNLGNKKHKPVSSAKPLVLNYDLAGNPFYSSHRVLSLD